MENIIEESSSNKYSSLERNIIESNSFNIHSHDFFNSEKSDSNNNSEYKIQTFDFSQEDESLSKYYENFYQ